MPKDTPLEQEPDSEVHFVHIDHGGGPSIEVRGMVVIGLGETGIRSEFPELFEPDEGLSAVNPDDEPELGVE